jgi:tRNA 2-selenouridine synthase
MRTADYRSLFLKNIPLIDVRAPVEFILGSLPGGINLPILNDEERAQVGTTYKEQGPDAAVALGHGLVSGSVKQQRLDAWISYIENHPDTILYCFRGGQRSQITQLWLQEAGVQRPLIQGGYKAVRQFLTEETDRLSQVGNWLIVSGPTGSGKTQFVQDFQKKIPTIDLENIARHRGSAFGGMDDPQPTQINFENQLGASLLRLETELKTGSVFLVEDESRMIGARHLPEKMFGRMRASKVLWIDDPMAPRIERILKEYVELPLQKYPDGAPVFEKFRKAIHGITKKLGGLRAQEILLHISDSEFLYRKHQDLAPNRAWIEKLLLYYYDPLYLRSLEQRQVRVAYKGPYQECKEFLNSNKHAKF